MIPAFEIGLCENVSDAKAFKTKGRLCITYVRIFAKVSNGF